MGSRYATRVTFVPPPSGLNLDDIVSAVLQRLRPLIGETHRESLKTFVATFPQPIYAYGTIIDGDVAKGTVEVMIDGETAPSPAVTIGPLPPAGERCMTVFMNGALYCLGTVGALRLVLPPTGDVTTTSTKHPLQIGLSSALNVAVDNNEIQARDGSSGAGIAAPFWLNQQGGVVQIGTQLTVDTLAGPPAGFLLGTVDGKPQFSCRTSGGLTDARFPTGLPVAPTGIAVTWTSTGSNQLGISISSRAVKDDIEPIRREDAAAAVARLRPSQFRYKLHDTVDPIDAANHVRLRLGFIAEEVAEDAPDAAVYDADNLPLAVDDRGLIALLVGAVHSATDRADRLEARLARLEAMLGPIG